jgi:hypothetical protein
MIRVVETILRDVLRGWWTRSNPVPIIFKPLAPKDIEEIFKANGCVLQDSVNVPIDKEHNLYGMVFQINGV